VGVAGETAAGPLRGAIRLSFVGFESFGQFQVAPVSVPGRRHRWALDRARRSSPNLRPFFSTCSSSDAETTVAPRRVLARLARRTAPGRAAARSRGRAGWAPSRSFLLAALLRR